MWRSVSAPRWRVALSVGSLIYTVRAETRDEAEAAAKTKLREDVADDAVGVEGVWRLRELPDRNS